MILYDKIIKVKKQKTISGNTRGYIATATGEASIQPVAVEANEIQDGRFGVLYAVYVEVDLPVAAGDQISDPEGTIYIVKEVLKRDTVPFPHQKLTVTKQRA